MMSEERVEYSHNVEGIVPIVELIHEHYMGKAARVEVHSHVLPITEVKPGFRNHILEFHDGATNGR